MLSILECSGAVCLASSLPPAEPDHTVLLQIFALKLLQDPPNLVWRPGILPLVICKLDAFESVDPPELDDDVEWLRSCRRIRCFLEIVGKVCTDTE